MKKIITLATLGLLVAAAPISAQTVYDAAKITGKDLNGTARFVGMGGAMGLWEVISLQLELTLRVSVFIVAMIL